jgi:septal ring factor EnvC (AmiA/AmiB activator)
VPQPKKPSLRRPRRALFGLLAAGTVLATGVASAADVDELESKVADARAQAGALAADLEAKQAQLVVAQQQAAAAAAQEQQLSALLVVGQQRAAELALAADRAEHRLLLERQRLRRARAALAERLVDIYKAGAPDWAALVLGSDGFDDLVTRSDYLSAIQEADASLAERVEQVRDLVRHHLTLTRRAKARVDAYNTRLDAARSQIASVRAAAEAEAAELQAIAASRAATIATLQASIDGWVQDIQAAQQAASAEAAQAEVTRWLGGPYSIPAYIVQCESGGNYGAVNPSSGAGGAYQILPSTWDLYGGQGDPEDAPKSQQDQIAAEIWADSGPAAWVCAG